jgi:hypothetical protein
MTSKQERKSKMRLNPDCIRDILITVEENTGYHKKMDCQDLSIYPLFTRYEHDEVCYHFKQCETAGLIEKIQWYLGGSFSVTDLTYSGHEFLSNIRDDTTWNSVKEKSKSIGSQSLTALMQIASNLITQIISSRLPL